MLFWGLPCNKMHKYDILHFFFVCKVEIKFDTKLCFITLVGTMWLEAVVPVRLPSMGRRWLLQGPTQASERRRPENWPGEVWGEYAVTPYWCKMSISERIVYSQWVTRFPFLLLRGSDHHGMSRHGKVWGSSEGNTREDPQPSGLRVSPRPGLHEVHPRVCGEDQKRWVNVTTQSFHV